MPIAGRRAQEPVSLGARREDPGPSARPSRVAPLLGRGCQGLASLSGRGPGRSGHGTQGPAGTRGTERADPAARNRRCGQGRWRAGRGGGAPWRRPGDHLRDHPAIHRNPGPAARAGRGGCDQGDGGHALPLIRVQRRPVMPTTRAGFVAVIALAAQVASAETLHVSAASSLTEAFQQIGQLFEKQHPGDAVEFNFAGSQVLRTQIEQGAAVDVFASADLVHADALKGSGLLGPYQVFARNRVVVVVPPQQGKVGSLQDLARPGVKVVVAGATVPVGRYTTQVLGRLSAAGLYGDDFQARVQANVVSQETNVRVVLAKIALGEADAGFVYATDAATAPDKVRPIDVPSRYNVVAEYPIGVLVRSALPEKANAFVALVLSEEGRGILLKRGFALKP